MRVTTRVLRKADARAQRRFRQMVREQVYAYPTDRRTRLYIEAERLIDRLRGSQAEFSLELAADWRMTAEMGDYAILPDIPLADPGDHFAGMRS